MLTKGPISPGAHGTLDYVLAAVLILTPFIAGFDSDTASAILIVAGVHQLQMALFTAWPPGVLPLISPPVHGVIDYLLVIALIAAPFGIAFHDETATACFVALGVGGLGFVAATRFVSD
jgi:hypothetical protein